ERMASRSKWPAMNKQDRRHRQSLMRSDHEPGIELQAVGAGTDELFDAHLGPTRKYMRVQCREGLLLSSVECCTPQLGRRMQAGDRVQQLAGAGANVDAHTRSFAIQDWPNSRITA